MALSSILEPFVWGKGGQRLTPEQLAKRRLVEEALLARGVDTSPVGHWTQGLARVANAAAGSFRRGQLAKQEGQNTQYNADLGGRVERAAAGMFGGGLSPSIGGGAPMGGGAGVASPPGPSPNMSGNGIYSEFMDTVKQGGLTNPYGLAAVAATGKAESGFSPGNAYRQWSDPSESGQQGMAGGIMSWRAERLNNLRQFAAANGDNPNRPSPMIQARFLMQENPALIGQLQNARSAEQAQQMMNNAWKFAGYNRPGGEAARRISLASSFVPQFAGGGQPVQVASLDPSIGMPQQTAGLNVGQATGGPVTPELMQQQPMGGPAGMMPPQAPAQPPQPVPSQRPDPWEGMREVTGPPAVSPGNPMTAGVGGAAQGAGGLDPAILEALTSPYASDSVKSIAELIFRRQLEQNDPMRLLQMENMRSQIADRQSGKSGIINAGDGMLYDPNTQQWISAPGQGAGAGGPFRFKGNSVEAQSLNGLMESGQLTPEQAQQLGAGKTITGPNGEIIFLTPQGVFGQSPQGGTPQPLAPNAGAGTTPPPAAPNRGNIPVTAPKTTLDERKAMTFADRMQASGKILNEMEKAGLGTKDQFVRGNDWIPDSLENWMVSDDFQKFDQARRDFINAQLRRESGAVISSEEFANANQQYFPQPNDSPEVLEQKRRNRQTVIDGMIRDGGPTYRGGNTQTDPLGIR